MSRNTRLLLGIALLIVGGASALMPAMVKKQIGDLDVLIGDAEDVLDEHRSFVINPTGQVDDFETAVEVHRMSYLARREELVIRLWTFAIGGPLIALLGLGMAIAALTGKRPPRRPRRRRRPVRRRRVRRPRG